MFSFELHHSVNLAESRFAVRGGGQGMGDKTRSSNISGLTI